MATDLSAATVAQSSDQIDQEPSPHPITNGAAPVSSEDAPGANQDSFMENSALNTSDVGVKDAPLGPNPAGPTPIDDVAGGIQPIADFIPKDAPTHSHPTPPPEQPLDTGDAEVDATMTNADDAAQPSSDVFAPPAPAPLDVEPAAAVVEPSLVRPREDDADDEDERAAKRSRVEPDAPPATDAAESAAESAISQPPPAAPSELAAPESAAQPAPSLGSTVAPPPAETPARLNAPPSAEQPASQTQPPPQPAASEAKSSIEPQSATGTPAPTSGAQQHSTAPMTELQKRALVEKMKNLKKTRNAVFFLKPVDVVALNIPTYPDIIKQPMDLGTMEQKLKNDQYGSVQDFVNDFELIIHNTRTFNGEAHAVTQTGMSMKAYFDKMMLNIPSADQVAPPKVQQKRASPPRQPPQRREPRAPPPPPVAAPAPAPTPKSEAYAVPADGVPQIRRESTNGRPARAIKPPANRDIPYAKPKRKEHQLELRFCEHVLDQIRSPRYSTVNSVFLMPVDPVALNIPHYRQVVKNPMDLSTMAQKLKQGEYGKASEFRKDFDLMIENCLAFNPQGNPVRDMGVQFRRHFDELWRGKDKWERANKPESARHTSASADEDSDADDDADEDDEPQDDKQQTIEALQKQLADMQNMIAGIASGGVAKPKKDKKAKVKDVKRKIGSLSSAVPKPKASAPKPKKPAKVKQVTYEEKQEISEAVGRMDDAQVAELTKIITENVPKYRDQDDMELEIDDLPNHVQLMLLRYVRKLFGKPRGAEPMSPPDDGEMEDDDFEPPERGSRGSGGVAAGKRKKHKPMGKREQQEKIEMLNSKLEQFKQVGTSGSESPTGASSFNPAKAESSGDDESEESEEE